MAKYRIKIVERVGYPVKVEKRLLPMAVVSDVKNRLAAVGVSA